MPSENLSPRFDIFRVEPDGPIWRGARQDLEEALKTAIDMTFEDHANYLIADIRTGEQTVVPYLEKPRALPAIP